MPVSHPHRRALALSVALATLSVAACDRDQPARPATEPSAERQPPVVAAPSEPPPASREALARRVLGFLDAWTQRESAFLEAYKRDFEAALGELRWFKKLSTAGYEARGFALRFSDGQDLRPAADAMIAAIEDLEAHGLDPEPYGREALRTKLKAAAEAKQAYLTTLVPPDDVDRARLWKLAERLRGGLAVNHGSIVSALGEAELDDQHVPLVDAAEARLEAMFEAKAALNDALRDLDIALMQGFFRYAYDMRLSRRVHPFLADPDDATGVERAADSLRQLYDETDFDALDVGLRALVPTFPLYKPTMEGLARYRRLAAEEEQVVLPKAVQRLRRGSKGDNVVLLQRRLAQEGYLELEGEPDGLYGEGLSEALTLYQETHQLDPSGAMDRGTRSSLNKAFADRADQIALSLQRYRESELHQGEHRFGSVPVQARVNIAAFEAVFYRDGAPARTHRVVVGSNAVSVDEDTGIKGHFNRTRLFTEQLQTIVLNPTWRVPSRIKEQELDEKLIEEPDFYEKNNYELKILDDGSEEVVQLPGPNNALGLVKFLFPNRFSIYMHDTPKKRLFNRQIRAYSHGCMRTHEALDLAKWVLTDLQEMTEARFEQILDSRQTYGIALENKIPITVEYNTVGVHESGRMMFFLDVYKFDSDLAKGKTPYEKPPHNARFEQVVMVR